MSLRVIHIVSPRGFRSRWSTGYTGKDKLCKRIRAKEEQLSFFFLFCPTVLHKNQILETTLVMSNQEFVILLQMNRALGALKPELESPNSLFEESGHRPRKN